MGIIHTEVMIIIGVLIAQTLWLSFIDFHLIKVIEFFVNWTRKWEEKDGNDDN